MLAVIAAICFLLALLKLSIGIDLTVLGFLFIAIHLAWGWGAPLVAARRGN